MDDYLKSVGKSVDHKKKIDGATELLNGAKSALAEAIQMVGSPIPHQKAVLGILSEAIFSFTTVAFSQIPNIVVKPRIYINSK